jgi:hypothetical protein
MTMTGLHARESTWLVVSRGRSQVPVTGCRAWGQARIKASSFRSGSIVPLDLAVIAGQEEEQRARRCGLSSV